VLDAGQDHWVIRSRFRVEYTLAGADFLLHRIGWSVQVPARRAAERDEARVAAWRAILITLAVLVFCTGWSMTFRAIAAVRTASGDLVTLPGSTSTVEIRSVRLGQGGFILAVSLGHARPRC
jgi:Winged helix-turn helix